MKFKFSTFILLPFFIQTGTALADNAVTDFVHSFEDKVESVIRPIFTGTEKPKYQGEVFQDVWNQIASDKYPDDVLPRNKQTTPALIESLGPAQQKMIQDAVRTLEDPRAILPPFDKLVHANGICFKGTWNITEETPYSGYFKKGKGLVIARASTASTDFDRGDYRALGLAGRIFPTTDPNETAPLQSANFFTIDDLGGTKNDHFTDSKYLSAPPATPHLDAPQRIIAAGLIGAAFAEAEIKESIDNHRLPNPIQHPNIRQVYQIAELGEANKDNIKSPKRMELVAAPDQTVEKADFRDELKLKNRGGKLRFNIMVSDEKNFDNMKQIGYLEFTEDAASFSCDHGFHVSHPPWVPKYE